MGWWIRSKFCAEAVKEPCLGNSDVITLLFKLLSKMTSLAQAQNFTWSEALLHKTCLHVVWGSYSSHSTLGHLLASSRNPPGAVTWMTHWGWLVMFPENASWSVCFLLCSFTRCVCVASRTELIAAVSYESGNSGTKTSMIESRKLHQGTSTSNSHKSCICTKGAVLWSLLVEKCFIKPCRASNVMHSPQLN